MPFALPLRSIERFASVIPISVHSSFEVMPRAFKTSSRCTLIAICPTSDKKVIIVAQTAIFDQEASQKQRKQRKYHAENGYI